MRRHLVLSAAALAFATCSGTPTQVFTLAASGDRATTPAEPHAPLVHVDRATVAETFDRSQMVTRIGEHRISLHEFAVWSEPIADLITGTVVDDLARRFGDDRVMRTPRSGTHDAAAARVELEVLRFDLDEQGQAVVEARWTVTSAGGATLRRRERVTAQAADPKEAPSRVMALRAALATLADHIATAVAGPAPRRG